MTSPVGQTSAACVRTMKTRLLALVSDLRADIGKIDEPQQRAMFETSAEVLTGLAKAFNDYEKKNEDAWRKS